jgi:hypothetical protein
MAGAWEKRRAGPPKAFELSPSPGPSRSRRLRTRTAQWRALASEK